MCCARLSPQQLAPSAVATQCEDEMDDCGEEQQLAMQKLEEAQSKLNTLEGDAKNHLPTLPNWSRPESRSSKRPRPWKLRWRCVPRRWPNTPSESCRLLEPSVTLRKMPFVALAHQSKQQLSEIKDTKSRERRLTVFHDLLPRLRTMRCRQSMRIWSSGWREAIAGIKVDATGVVISAPGGLFDKDYMILGIDGQNLDRVSRIASVTYNIILRCKKPEILLDPHRSAPAKLLKGKALKLMQVKITLWTQGFRIDLQSQHHRRPAGGGRSIRLASRRCYCCSRWHQSRRKEARRSSNKSKPSHIFTIIRPQAALSKQTGQMSSPAPRPRRGCGRAAPRQRRLRPLPATPPSTAEPTAAPSSSTAPSRNLLQRRTL